jgi:ABC-2 type transport system ATP-binding protein
MTQPAVMIQVDKVSKNFGPVQAVDGVSFSVQRGEVVGFLGPNGAGKSTTIKILTTYLPASSGVAHVAGHDVMAESMEVRSKIGYLPESVPLYPEMRVEEYLTYRSKLKGVDRHVRPRRVEHCLERCRIREVRRRLIGTLSKGYRQRVGLADAMIHDPPILILDEPTVGLDPVQIRETLSLIKDLGREHTILLSTHILSEVEAVCQRVIIISAGRIGLDRRLSDLEAISGHVVLEARGPVEAVAACIRAMEGVVGVDSRPLGDNVYRHDIHVRQDLDVREELSQRVVRNGWTIRRLDQRAQRLEDLFIDVVVRERRMEPPAPPAPATAPPSLQVQAEAPKSEGTSTDGVPAPPGSPG